MNVLRLLQLLLLWFMYFPRVLSLYNNPKRLCHRPCATEVRALYGRLSCGWLRVVCAWRPWLRWEVGGAG